MQVLIVGFWLHGCWLSVGSILLPGQWYAENKRLKVVGCWLLARDFGFMLVIAGCWSSLVVSMLDLLFAKATALDIQDRPTLGGVPNKDKSCWPIRLFLQGPSHA